MHVYNLVTVNLNDTKKSETLARAEVSVVIATLGGQTLSSTIESLNAGSVRPSEILVCIPTGNLPCTQALKFDNVTLVQTSVRGQVAQRAFGFRAANFEWVLQLDDDITVSPSCVERLLETSQEFGLNVAVAPALINQDTGQSVYVKPTRPKSLLAIYFWLMNGVKGYRPGTIDKAGSAIGVDPATADSRFVEVEWLAGGCMLHRRENLVLEDFWARPGKAYCEDVVHSHILGQRGVRLIVDTSARCELEVGRQSTMTFRAFLTDFYRDFSARRYYMKRVSRSSARMYLYYLVRFASHVWGRLRWKRSEL